jgi:acyl-CoA thioesterase I
VRRLSWAALAGLALVDLVGAGYVLTHNNDSSDPAPRLGIAGVATSRPAPSSAPGSRVASTPAPGSATASRQTGEQPVVAFLGDDWTAGTAASSPKKRFSTLVSRHLGLQERNFGADGSGYAKSGPDGPYSSRLAALVATHPAIVVVAGGRNDVHDDPATAGARIDELFRTLRTQLPDATLVALAPMWGDSDKPAALLAIATQVEDAVTAAGGTYLDVADPIHGRPELMADDADPADAGYAAIAAAVEPVLRPLAN